MKPIRIELPTGLAMGSVNVYLFTGPEPLLVDTGIKTPQSWEALQFGLAEQGLEIADLSRVVITHPHVDHFGQAGRIVANSDADVWIAELGAPWLLATADRWQKRQEYYRTCFLPAAGLPPDVIEMVLAGMADIGSRRDFVPAERLHTFPMDGTLQMGGMAWQVLHTPGHASMQTCFYQPETRLLLSADMLLAVTPTPVVERPSGEGCRRVPSLPQFLRSLELVEALAVDMVYPGHGRPFANYREIIRRQRNRIMQRKAECLHWVEAGCQTPAQLLEKMYAHHPVHVRFAGLWMLMGYLDLLEADGLVQQRTQDGVWHYFARK